MCGDRDNAQPLSRFVRFGKLLRRYAVGLCARRITGEFFMRTRIIHLINPKTDSLTTRPIYLNRALYSPLAGLLAVAASIPRDQYEVVLTDENIEPIDFDLKADLVGISAMTSYVKRGYEIAHQFRDNGVPVVMGGVHPSFMPQEALKHCDAVVIGEVELVIDKLLDDLKQGAMRGTYKSDTLHPMAGMPMPRYDLLDAEQLLPGRRSVRGV